MAEAEAAETPSPPEQETEGGGGGGEEEEEEEKGARARAQSAARLPPGLESLDPQPPPVSTSPSHGSQGLETSPERQSPGRQRPSPRQGQEQTGRTSLGPEVRGRSDQDPTASGRWSQSPPRQGPAGQSPPPPRQGAMAQSPSRQGPMQPMTGGGGGGGGHSPSRWLGRPEASRGKGGGSVLPPRTPVHGQMPGPAAGSWGGPLAPGQGAIHPGANASGAWPGAPSAAWPGPQQAAAMASAGQYQAMPNYIGNAQGGFPSQGVQEGPALQTRSRGAAQAALQKFSQFEAAARSGELSEALDQAQVSRAISGPGLEVRSPEEERQRRAAEEAKAQANAKRLTAPFPSSAPPASSGSSGATETVTAAPAALGDADATAAAEQAEETRYIGRIKAFNTDQGYGFIVSADIKTKFGCDAFLNQAVEGGVVIGGIVSFSVELSKDGKPQARHVVLEQVPGTLFANSSSEDKSASTLGRDTIADALGARGAAGPAGNTYRGRVKSFNAARGFGFLSCPDLQRLFGGKDIFVSRTVAPDGRLIVGQEVEFVLTVDRQGQPQGKDIVYQTPIPANGANNNGNLGGIALGPGKGGGTPMGRRPAGPGFGPGVGGMMPAGGPGMMPAGGPIMVPAGGEAHHAGYRLFDQRFS